MFSAVLLGLVLTLVPPPAHLEVHASPRTLIEDLELTVPAGQVTASAHAAGPGMARSAATVASQRFSMVGFELPEDVDRVLVRTRDTDAEVWSEWSELEVLGEEDGPDPGTDEHARAAAHRTTDSLWVGDADAIEVALPGALDDETELTAVLIDSDHLNDGPVDRYVVSHLTAQEAQASASPSVISRAAWGANESWRSGTPTRWYGAVEFGVVHHTAGSNSYTREQAAGVVRGIYSWHTLNNGWNDIGYNVLIDRFGRIYEGRWGGLTNGVSGAHAAGYNSRSFGVSIMGNFQSTDPPRAALDALTDVIAWQTAVYGIDPLSGTTRTGWSGNGTSYQGNIVGHQQVGSTACPGRIMNHLWSIRQTAKSWQSRYPQGPYVDVSPSSVHAPAISALTTSGVVQGCAAGAFCPSRQLTRAQLATMLANARGLAPRTPSFSDVPAGSTHAGAIGALAHLGIITGFPDGTFRPDLPVTREQAATFIHGTRGGPDGTSHPFTDVSTSNPHRGAIAALYRDGVTNGCTTTRYCARDNLRRDEAASLIHRGFPS
jgi:hypothetical protein